MLSDPPDATLPDDNDDTPHGLSRRHLLGLGAAALLAPAFRPARAATPVAAGRNLPADVTSATPPGFPWKKFHLDIAPGPTLAGGGQLIRINSQPSGPEIRLKKGEMFYVTVRNRLKQPTTVHWHGIIVPNLMDGVPDVSQVPLPAGIETTYAWPVVQSGTFWYHSHMGLQEQQGLAGPLILESPDNDGLKYDREAVLFMEDRLTADPEQVLAALQGKPAPSAAQAAVTPPSQPVFPYPGGKMFGVDVQYGLFPLNGRLPDEPAVIDARPGEVLRLRILNASASSYFLFNVQSHPLEVVAKDGNRTRPLPADNILLATAERYDALVRVGKPGIYRITGAAIGQTGGALALLRVGGAPLPGKVAAPSPANTRLEGKTIDADDVRAPFVTELPAAPVETVPEVLAGNMQTYRWSINGEYYPDARPELVTAGRRVRLEVVNDTMMFHPMHLHGHFFRVEREGMTDAAHSALMDTYSVPPKSRVTLAFYSDNPGRWVFHCHNMYHMVTGMLRVIEYRAGG
ncbi:multicopper oxidase family protein [Laribacter hongkongensis]|uniref:multicopper oxidase family protein n=1 Tax=Laribacter hongkongensis TaxID=168471 RepID=UPI001EFC5AA8|nr:multicopper oxidase family protein [Laribacter hongkongensis]MCG9059897.1 multicopper oxidase family protein [Laribacter hongkongensis]MCG9086249.1 multicopper oxidase family protein [Laribacter hongkongensis]